ncbi:MAG TPA: hypothetical protein VJR89_23835 [Polyangiales bacterium]|nr:hypothetical protein [Polyangiales bacterium]
MALTVGGCVRIRVVGVAFGFLRCRAQLRWVWGRFDETFRVAAPRAPLRVVAWGLGGRASYHVELGPLHDLALPPPPRLRALPRVAARSPRVLPLTAAGIAELAAKAREAS